MKKIIYLAMAIMLATSCMNKTEKEQKPKNNIQSLTETYVDTMRLTLTSFDNQTVCNGRLQALSTSVLTFPKSGYITSIRVSEGQRVGKGAVIATIDATERQREVDRAKHELERTRVTLIDKLIGLGYDADMKGVPADVMHRAEVTSGYYSAKYDLTTAQTALAECTLHAPTSGRIASIEGKLHQMSDKVCTLIDDSQFDVEFKVLESELRHVKVGHEVIATPFINDSLHVSGRITEINPIVDDKGLVKVVARISGGHQQLLDGMNMRVVINQRVKQMFVVPKDAVVERDGYHVIFLLRDGHAVWTYVDIVHSNISSYAITGCARKDTHINEGDIVITSGNLNLADGTEVKINEK